MWVGYSLALRRAALTKKDCHQDEDGGRQKLALPVLKTLKPERTGDSVLSYGLGLCAMLERFFGGAARAVPHMQHESSDEKRQ